MPIKVRYKLQLGRFAHAPQPQEGAEAATGSGAAAHGEVPQPSQGTATQGEAQTTTVAGRVAEADSDFWLSYVEGETLGTLFPISDRAAVWADNHLDPEAEVHEGGIVIEHRFIPPIVAAIKDHGMTIEVN
jgi:hypothetical protein